MQSPTGTAQQPPSLSRRSAVLLFASLAVILSAGFIACGILAHAHWNGVSELLSVSGSFLAGHQSDEEMIRNLRQHRAKFDELLVMLESDPQVGLVYTNEMYYDPAEMGIDVERHHRYATLLRQVGVDVCLERDADTVTFAASSSGLAVSGSVKGYVYSVTPPEPLVDSLDHYLEDESTGRVYRHIEGHWYLFYDWDW